MKVLVLNAGSSSQKACLYELGDSLPGEPLLPLWEAYIDWSGSDASPKLRVMRRHIPVVEQELHTESRGTAIGHVLGTLWDGPAKVIGGPSEVDVVGHRVVHGGPDYMEATVITPEVKAAIGKMAVLAPLQNCTNLEGIEAVERVMGGVPQIGVFDTAFHSRLPLAAIVYPGPYEWFEKGIRRFGFHGINHQYCAHRASELLQRDLKSLRLLTCHLGSGCSLAAIRDGRSVDTTMGFTPLEGLMMGSRSGSIDPGILIYLLRNHGYSAEDLDQILNQESGLRGISGRSSDMREVLRAMEKGDARARLAVDLYVHRLNSSIGAMLATLGGLDALVFTAGVGENSPLVRAAACEAFEFLGLKIDPERNRQSPIDQDIATADSTVRVLVVRAQEDWEIARECWKLRRESEKEK